MFLSQFLCCIIVERCSFFLIKHDEYVQQFDSQGEIQTHSSQCARLYSKDRHSLGNSFFFFILSDHIFNAFRYERDLQEHSPLTAVTICWILFNTHAHN